MEKIQAIPDAHALMHRATDLVASGRTGAARPLLAALRRLGPPTPALAQLAARIALQDGALDKAGAELDAALDITPDHAGLRVARAELRQQCGDLEGAVRDAAEAVILDRGNPTPKALLGILMVELGRIEDALPCLREAVSAQPSNPSFLRALALAQSAAGELDTAFATLETGIAANPASIELRNDAVMLCVRRRDFATAERLCDQARIAGIADATTFGLRGHALSSLGAHQEAAEAYADALKLQPNDQYVRHLAAASGVVPSGTRASEPYLRRTFDNYAERFDAHLISLGYRAPGSIRKIMLDHPLVTAGRQLGPVLDLGCGTGLVALALSDLAIGPYTGVDVSSGMLQQAAAKNLYEALHQADLMVMLASNSQHWPLVLAADVLCYFGALEELFRLVHTRLEPSGWFVFSTEELLPHYDGTVPGNGQWALQRQGRYAHAPSYLTALASETGFRLLRIDREIVRFEANSAVPGLLCVFERVRHDG